MEISQLPSPSSILQNVINALGVDPATFAREIGFARPDNLYKVLKGKAAPSWGTLIKLATRYQEVSAEFLVRGEGEVFRKRPEREEGAQQQAMISFAAPMAAQRAAADYATLLDQKDEIINLLKTENEFLKTLIIKPPQPTPHQN